MKKVIGGIFLITAIAVSAFIFTCTRTQERAVANDLSADQEQPVEYDLSIEGVWNDWAGTEFIFQDGNWELWYIGSFGSRGTFTADKGEITMEITDINTGEGWISYTAESQTGTYSVSGNVLSLVFDGETRMFSRQ